MVAMMMSFSLNGKDLTKHRYTVFDSRYFAGVFKACFASRHSRYP